VLHRVLGLLVKILEYMLERLTGDKKLHYHPEIPNVSMQSSAANQKVS
jgi:hypothetical protein